MRRTTFMAPTSTSTDNTTLRKRVVLLFALVLALGLLTPTAAFAAPGQLSVRDRVVGETAGNVSVRIVLAQRVGHRVAVSFRTVNGTAVAGQDYTSTSGRVRFPAGAKVRHVSVPILDDDLVEPDETFKVRIYDPYRARVLDRTGVVTLRSEDVTPLPVLTVADDTAQEGDDLVFAVSLSKPATTAVTFDYATVDGTAKAAGDFTAVAAGEGTIVVGAKATTLTVKSTEDSTAEQTERFTVKLSSPVGAAFGDDEAEGTITDDDPGVSLSIANLSVTEGKDAEVVVSLDKAAAYEVKVQAATSNGTATAGSDYTARDDTVTIPAGSTSAKFVVKTTDDGTDEVNETFAVDLAAPHDATIADGHAVVTILDNDGPALSIGDQHATEGADLVFTISLSKASAQDVMVGWKTSDGTAKAGQDYTAAHGTVTILAGHLTASVTVKTTNDTTDEPSEAFYVELSTPVDATIADGKAEGLIVDNDPPSASIGDAHATEGSPMVFKVTLTSTSDVAVTIDFATANGTATAPGDYTAKTDHVVIQPGHLVGEITVATVDDVAIDPDEKFSVTLSNGVNASIGDAHGEGLIVDND